MKMTQEDYEQQCSNDAGYCKNCDDITVSGIESDADGYDCPDCDQPTVMGVENALVYGEIDIVEEDENEVDIISFGNDED